MTLDGSQKYLHDMLDMSEELEESTESVSEIAQFFTGLNVMITGASGFLGRLLVERLLRCCPYIGVMYIAMRDKKGKTAEERFKEYFDDVIFTRVMRKYPNCCNKVIMVKCDTSQEDLGLSTESRLLLLDTHVIFHTAAIVRFDEHIRKAVNINVRGTKQLLLLAKEMPNLMAFVHVSTAFSHSVQKLIDEIHYEPPMKPDNILKLMEILDDKILEQITPSLLGNFPNTYIYSKAIGENAVKQYSIGIPTCIIRPSIVIATVKEPLYAWINNIYGVTGVCVGAAAGVLRTLHCDENKVAEIIPADYVISNIIACAWDTAVNRKIPGNINPTTLASNMTDAERIPIFNCVSSCQNPVLWTEIFSESAGHVEDAVSAKIMWYPFLRMTKHFFLYYIYMISFHFLPAALVDTFLYLTGRKPKLWTVYKKIHKFSKVISYFSTQEWDFRNKAVVKLWDKLSPTDQNIFCFNVNEFDWCDYWYYHLRGIRLYMIKDPFETINAGLTKYRRLQYIHYTLIATFGLALSWFLYALYSIVFR